MKFKLLWSSVLIYLVRNLFLIKIEVWKFGVIQGLDLNFNLYLLIFFKREHSNQVNL